MWYKSIKIFEQDKIGEWDRCISNEMFLKLMKIDYKKVSILRIIFHLFQIIVLPEPYFYNKNL